MAHKNKFKLWTDISQPMKNHLLEMVFHHYGYKKFATFTMGIGWKFYQEPHYLNLIPDTHTLYQIHQSFGALSSNDILYNNLVFTFPLHVKPYFDFIRQIFFRSSKYEANFFIYCLFTNLYYKKTDFLTQIQ